VFVRVWAQDEDGEARGSVSLTLPLQYVNGVRVVRSVRWDEIAEIQLHPAPPRNYLQLILMGLPFIVCNERNKFVVRGYDSPFGNFLLLSDEALADASRALADQAAAHGVEYCDRTLSRR
jgi:hypothetical protein